MSKTKKIITIIMTSLASAMAILSGVMKFVKTPQIVESLTKVDVIDYVYFLGSMEIGFAILFIFPKTFKIGFLLLTCYFAGALATELSHHTPFNAITPLVLIWIAAFLRDSSLFLPTPEAKA